MSRKILFPTKLLLFLFLLAFSAPALAYYDPGVQRWINRDPFADYGSQELIRENLATPRKINNANLQLFIDNDPAGNVDAYGLATFKGCLSKQENSMKQHLKNRCAKAKECARKCPQSAKALAGIAKLCENENYQINCVHKDNKRCQEDACGYSPVGGTEMNICPEAFESNSLCGKAGPGCIMFHEALHSGGLTHEPDHPSDFNDLEKCMGCGATSKR